MKRVLSLLLLLLFLTIGYADEALDLLPVLEVLPSASSESIPVDFPLGYSVDPGEGGDFQPPDDILLGIYTNQLKLLSFAELYTYYLLPFGLAFLICWQLGKWFRSTFIQ